MNDILVYVHCRRSDLLAQFFAAAAAAADTHKRHQVLGFGLIYFTTPTDSRAQLDATMLATDKVSC
jgi:hypothetical protein